MEKWQVNNDIDKNVYDFKYNISSATCDHNILLITRLLFVKIITSIM